MDLVLLTKTIVELLCEDKEVVSVKEYETTDENLIQIEVLVSQNDLGRVIGKNGKTIHSIRNIVQASSNLNVFKKIKIDVDITHNGMILILISYIEYLFFPPFLFFDLNKLLIKSLNLVTQTRR